MKVFYSATDQLIRRIRWAAEPVAWRGLKVAAVGMAIFLAAGALLLLAAAISWPWLSWPVQILGAMWGLIGWAIVTLGVIGKLRWLFLRHRAHSA